MEGLRETVSYQQKASTGAAVRKDSHLMVKRGRGCPLAPELAPGLDRSLTWEALNPGASSGANQVNLFVHRGGEAVAEHDLRLRGGFVGRFDGDLQRPHRAVRDALL